MSQPSPPVCLTIGAADCTGASGTDADLKTFTALACYGAAATTAIEARKGERIIDLHPVDERSVRAQLEAVAAELPVAAVKVGFIPNVAVLRVVARWLREHPRLPLVMDPSMTDSKGIPLLTPESLAAMRDELLPRATLMVANRFEAAALAGLDEVVSREDMEQAARSILHQHGCAALVTGGGLAEGSLDVLAALDGLRHFNGRTVAGDKVPGSGPTHSAAVVAGLAKGDSLREAVMAAKMYITAAIASAARLANGRATIWHAVTVSEQVIVEQPKGG